MAISPTVSPCRIVASHFSRPRGSVKKDVEFAFDQDPKLGNLVTGRRQRLTRRERSHESFAGDGCKLLGIQAFTEPDRPQASQHSLVVRCQRWHVAPQ